MLNVKKKVDKYVWQEYTYNYFLVGVTLFKKSNFEAYLNNFHDNSTNYLNLSSPQTLCIFFGK